MKNILLICSALLMITSCRDKVIHQHMANVPIYEDYESFRSSIAFEGVRAIENQMGIYSYNQYLFVVEENEGIHFIDNSNPSSPNKLGFLNVRGCTGMAIKNNKLYVNNLIDIAVIDVANIQQPTVIARLEDVFPQNYPLGEAGHYYQKPDPEKGVVIGWEIQEVKEEVENSPYYYGNLYQMDNVSVANESIATGGASGSSVAGSITKFALNNDHLYVMNDFNLHAINISNPMNLTQGEPVRIWRTVETLFPYDNHLYMGTTTGMMIYSLANPESPEHQGTIVHTTACDPVVVQGDYAYVTIRSGTTCMGEINQLDVVDVSNPANPILKSSFSLTNPHGLGVNGDVLFVCDGSDGLKVFDNTDPLVVGDHLTQSFSTIQAIDIIPLGNLAIVLTKDGVYQYDCTDVQNIQYLSQIQ